MNGTCRARTVGVWVVGVLVACKAPGGGPSRLPAPAVQGGNGELLADATSEPEATLELASPEATEDKSVVDDASSDADEIDADGDTSETAGEVDAASDVTQACSKAGWCPQPCTAEVIPGLPKPGEPCATKGARRCSDAAAINSGSADPYFEYCVRPNLLECLPDATGKLRWTLRSCIDVMTAELGPVGSCQVKPICVEDSGSAVCVSQSLHAPQDEHGPFLHCPATKVGAPACWFGWSSLGECQKFQGGAFQGKSKPIMPFKADAFATCGKFAEGGTYWVSLKLCSEEFFPCPKGSPSKPKTTQASCDLYDGVYRCSKTCEEALASQAKKSQNPP